MLPGNHFIFVRLLNCWQTRFTSTPNDLWDFPQLFWELSYILLILAWSSFAIVTYNRRIIIRRYLFCRVRFPNSCLREHIPEWYERISVHHCLSLLSWKSPWFDPNVTFVDPIPFLLSPLCWQLGLIVIYLLNFCKSRDCGNFPFINKRWYLHSLYKYPNPVFFHEAQDCGASPGDFIGAEQAHYMIQLSRNVKVTRQIIVRCI